MTEITRTQAAYSAIATHYARTWNQPPPWLIDEADRFAGLLGSGARIADLGCGPGLHTRLLRERGLVATGFDLSAEMLAAACTPGLVRADMLKLPIAAGALDGIWCVAALLHIPRTLVPAALGECARVLRPGGELALSIAEGDGEAWESVRYGIVGREQFQRYYVLHRLEDLSSLLTGAGFDVYGHWRRPTNRQWLHIQARKRTP